jgi:hypothetical protein
MEERAMRIPRWNGRRGRPIVGFLFGLWIVALLAACSSGAASAPGAAYGGSTAEGQAPVPIGAAAPAASSGAARDSAGSGSSTGGGAGNEVAFVDDAKIVRTGSLQLDVADVAKALIAGRDAIRTLGGYIGASQQQRSGEDTIATVTYRIPAARWEEALDALRGLGTVQGETTDATEVTSQIVDLDARIRNLKASEQALVGYAEKAPKISDLLEIQSRLTDTRGQIEQLTAQQANLQDRAALATLAVSYSVKVVALTKTAEGWDPAAEVNQASATLLGMLQGLATFAIVFAIVWLPVIVVITILVAIGLVVARRMGLRRPTGTPPFVPPAVSPPA